MGQKILVVDDDADVRESLSFLLSMSGYDVREAENGAEALQVMHEEKPQLAVLDLMMPVMDGYELRRRMMADDELSELPVVVVSGAADLAGPEIDGCVVLTKPVEPDRLLRVVADCLREQVSPDGGPSGRRVH